MRNALVVAALTGLTWYAAHPPLAVWWLVFLVVPGWMTAVHLVRDRRARDVAVVGAVVGLAAFLPLLEWIAGTPATPVAWLTLSAAMAAWVALASLALRDWTTSPAVAVVGPLLWTAMEVLRARVPFSGFGWADLASAHTADSWMLTSARVIGADGLTLLTALFGGLLWVAVRGFVRALPEIDPGPVLSPGIGRVVGAFDAVRPFVLGAVGVAVLGTLITVGVPQAVGEADVLVVQGNDGRTNLGGAAEDLRIAERHRDLTVAAIGDGPVPDLVAWAENAIDRDPTTERGADLAPAVRAAATVTEGRLVAGVTRDGVTADTFRNSAALIDEQGRLVTVYDKQVPVPFAEYVPFRAVLGDIGPFRLVPRDAAPGAGPVTLDVDGLRVVPIICFETLFGDLVLDAVSSQDAGLVVAMTNNSTFGRTAAAAQHIAQSRLRAVETGRTVVHVAVSGSSAVLTADGEVLDATGLYEEATIRRTVPVRTGSTPAATVAEPLAWAVAVVGLVLAAASVWRRRSDRHTDRTAADDEEAVA